MTKTARRRYQYSDANTHTDGLTLRQAQRFQRLQNGGTVSVMASASASSAAKEEDFQDVANKAAHNSIEWMREHLDDEEQRERIMSEDALEVSVRTGWHNPGSDANAKPEEYYILLGTGGPATRIAGKLNEHCEPETARYEYQDWFKPWTAATDLSETERATLLEYAQQFYFGE